MSDVSRRISAVVNASDPGHVWTPADFAQLGSRDVIDKTLQRMVLRDQLRRIDRGLYDKPAISSLTKRATSPDYRSVIDAIARRDNLRLLVDGMTAANDLGLTTAVPARVTVYTDTRRRSIVVGNLHIEFKLCAPSRLYWAGRPAMRVVQALHWLKDTMSTDSDHVKLKIANVLHDGDKGASIRDDLRQGFSALPIWMQDFLRDMLDLSSAPLDDKASKPKRKASAKEVDQVP